MVCRKNRILRTRTVLVSLSFFGQALPGQDGNARSILELSEVDQVAFITSTMDRGFPEDRADQMTMLIINRSSLTVPLIEERLEQALKSSSLSTKFIDIASEMIAYAGDEHAFRAVIKLTAVDRQRFEHLVGRTLDNSLDRRNPFFVAYAALEHGNESIR